MPIMRMPARAKAIRFAATGVLATATHVLIAMFMMTAVTHSAPAANMVAFAAATALSYLVNSTWSFAGQHSRRSLPRYLMVSAAGLGLSAAISAIAQSLGLHYLAGVLLVLMVVPAISFLLHAKWTYRTAPSSDKAHAAPSSAAAPAPARRSPEEIAFLLACLVATAPIWAAVFPPMVDLPQHAAQISLFYALRDPAFAFADLFALNLFTPYLFGYGVIALLVPAVGIVVACKIAISLAIAATPLATRFLLREVGADPYLAWLSFPALYGFAYQWGFVNFLLAAPLGLLALAFIWRQDRQPSLATSLVIALLFNFLFFCHALALALFGVTAALYWACRERTLKSFVAHAWPVATVFPLAMIWLLSQKSHPIVQIPTQWDLGWLHTVDAYYSHMATWTDQQAPGWGRISGLFSRLFGIRAQLDALVLGLLLAALPFGIARFRFSWTRSVPLAVCAAVLLLVPGFVFGTAFVFHRFTQYLLPFYLFLFLPAQHRSDAVLPRIARALPPALAFLWIGMMTQKALGFNEEARDFAQAIAEIPAERRALSLVFLREDHDSIAPTFLHFPAWYSALKKGVVDKSFAMTQVQPVVYRPEAIAAGALTDHEWEPEFFFRRKIRDGQYDYFIVRAEVDVSPQLFAAAACPPQPFSQVGSWWVYQRNPARCHR